MIFVLILVVIVIGWFYIEAKTKIKNSNKMLALKRLDFLERTGTVPPEYCPSWMSNQQRMKEFVVKVFVQTSLQGVPESFLHKTLSNELDRAKIMIIVGTLEQTGSSFEKQAMAASKMVTNAWNRTHYP